MTRDDEIINRSIDYGQKTPSEYDDGRYDLSDLEWAFEEGAKWADKTMIEKACEWLKEFTMDYVNDTKLGFCKKEFVEDFKKAMDE